MSYLLFLEKQFADVHTLLRKLPVLDASESWTQDPSTDAWKTAPVRTVRAKKVPRNHVKAEATDKDPAQVDVYLRGRSGRLLDDREVLRRAARAAGERIAGPRGEVAAGGEVVREEANGIEVTDEWVGESPVEVQVLPAALTRRGGPTRQRRTAINLRLLLAPPGSVIGGSGPLFPPFRAV